MLVLDITPRECSSRSLLHAHSHRLVRGVPEIHWVHVECTPGEPAIERNIQNIKLDIEQDDWGGFHSYARDKRRRREGNRYFSEVYWHRKATKTLKITETRKENSEKTKIIVKDRSRSKMNWEGEKHGGNTSKGNRWQKKRKPKNLQRKMETKNQKKLRRG